MTAGYYCINDKTLIDDSATLDECSSSVLADSTCDAGLGHFVHNSDTGACHCCTADDATTNTSYGNNDSIYLIKKNVCLSASSTVQSSGKLCSNF